MFANPSRVTRDRASARRPTIAKLKIKIELMPLNAQKHKFIKNSKGRGKTPRPCCMNVMGL